MRKIIYRNQLKKFAGIVLLVILITFQINAQDTLSFNRDYLPAENKVLVFIPHTAEVDSGRLFESHSPESAAKTFPLMFLLHGYSGNYSDWSKAVDLQKYADTCGFIIVCPDGYYNSWYLDSPVLPNWQFQKFFWKDLVPTLLNNYGKMVNRKEIFITGLSMGGHGALNIFMSNDSFFLAAGSMSGILDIRKFPTQWELSRVLGNYNKKNRSKWDNNSVMENLNKIKSKKNCKLIIDCGTEDFAYPVNVQFKEKAEKMGINLIFDSRPGIHDWIFWKDALINHLRYFKSLCK